MMCASKCTCKYEGNIKNAHRNVFEISSTQHHTIFDVLALCSAFKYFANLVKTIPSSTQTGSNCSSSHSLRHQIDFPCFVSSSER